MRRCLLVLSVLLGGCFGGTPETRYYSLRGEKLVEPRPGPQGAPVALLDHFAIDDAYADDRVAYRREGHELGFDPYSRWAGSSVAQVEDSVRDLLRAKGIFSDVRQPQPLGEGRSSYDLVVTGRVGRLEEVDLSEDEWEGALDVELFLLDGKSRAVLVSTHFMKAEKAEKRNPRYVAEALGHLVSQAVDEFAQRVKPVIETRAHGAR